MNQSKFNPHKTTLSKQFGTKPPQKKTEPENVKQTVNVTVIRIMYVLRAFCAFSFLVIIFHSLARSLSLSHSLTLCLSVSFLLLLLLFVCCVHSLSIIFCVSNKQLQLTPPLFPRPSTFNPNKPTIFVSLHAISTRDLRAF